MPNKLIKEKSPYLLRNANSPIDWYPWGEEAFRRAREEDKPIFLSIGYSSCHWCYVMEKETFENEEVARLLNENFIPIKVDREELPEVDELYIRAVQIMVGEAGWPLTVFLTPDLKPFFGGTYFPPYRRGTLPGLVEILRLIIDAWRNERELISKTSNDIMEILRRVYSSKSSDGELSSSVIEDAFEQIVSIYDEKYGGFSLYPKFPMTTFLFFLHRFYYRTKRELALRISLNTLLNIALGGIHDQLAGGFHRYSTDRYWIVPHFEKMLYDNALLARAYIEAYLLTKDDFMLKVALKTLDWIISDMSSPNGGFYASISSDSEDGEGAYYLWTKDQILSLLGEKIGEIVCKYYGVTSQGNYGEGKNVLYVRRTLESLATEFSIPLDDLRRIIEYANAKLLSERKNRKAPSIDRKIITSWNALAISAMCIGFQVSGDRRYIEAATSTANFILKNMYRDGILFRRYIDSDVAYTGTLEDYAFFINSLLDLYETTFDPIWLEIASKLNEEMIERFYDRGCGGFFITERDISGLILKNGKDGSIPSGNSLAIMNLIRLSEFLVRPDLLDLAKRSLLAFFEDIKQNPIEYTYMLTALDYYLSPRREIVFICNEQDCSKFIKALWLRFIPDKITLVCNPDSRKDLERITPIVKDKRLIDGKTSVYICENYTCRAPITSIEDFLRYLDEV